MAGIDVKDIRLNLVQVALLIANAGALIAGFTAMREELKTTVQNTNEIKSRQEQVRQEYNTRLGKMEVEISDLRVRVALLEVEIKKNRE